MTVMLSSVDYPCAGPIMAEYRFVVELSVASSTWDYPYLTHGKVKYPILLPPLFLPLSSWTSFISHPVIVSVPSLVCSEPLSSLSSLGHPDSGLFLT